MELIWKPWALSAMFLLVGVAEASVFDVKNYGAVADGKTDISKALILAWTKACASVQPSTVLISKGTYLLSSVVLSGPCKTPSMGFQLQGVLAQDLNHPASFNNYGWISFNKINGLTVYGGGTFDGQGKNTWKINNCSPKCPPINLRFDFSTNIVIQDITSLNSRFFHINIFKCQDVHLQHLTILAPGNSINTDGIHIGDSSRIKVNDAVIATGDDCISVGPGTQNLNITKVVCGPGHGISVGSLGLYKGEAKVDGVYVRNCTLINTQNGVRIKTFPSSPPGAASNILFEDIIMDKVYNPVILDQEYCPHYQCNNKAPSLVKLTNIEFNKIRGTSLSQLAVNIACSKAVPCENLKIGDINLHYTGPGGTAQSTCSNVKPIFFGHQIPSVVCTKHFSHKALTHTGFAALGTKMQHNLSW